MLIERDRSQNHIVAKGAVELTIVVERRMVLSVSYTIG
jgi:hypothetical protein